MNLLQPHCEMVEDARNSADLAEVPCRSTWPTYIFGGTTARSIAGTLLALVLRGIDCGKEPSRGVQVGPGAMRAVHAMTGFDTLSMMVISKQ